MVLGNVHAGITVSNIERSVEWYEKVLGLKLEKIEPVQKKRGEKLGVPGAEIQCAVFEYGDGCHLEIIEYKHPEPPNEKGAPVNAIGQVHIALYVDDLGEQIEHMKQFGVEFVGGPEYAEVTNEGPFLGWKWIYLKDPDGTNLELIELPK